MMPYIFLLIGVILFTLAKLNKATAVPGFTIGYFISKNGVAIAMNLVAGIAIILSGYYQAKIHDVVTLNLRFIELGITGSFLFQSAMDMLDRDRPTSVGINKDDVVK